MIQRGYRRHRPVLALVLILGGGASAAPVTAFGQTADGPAEVALKLVAALKAHDNATAATYLVSANRQDFVSLMEASAQLATVRKRLDERTSAAFGTDDAITLQARQQTGPDAVLTAEVVTQTQVDPNTTALTLDLVTSNATPVQHVSWRAIKENGAWKIELPACASPTEAAGLRQRMAEMGRIAESVTEKIDGGVFSSPAAARAALIQAEQSAAAPTRQ